jgi:hypothetical protein
MDGCEYKLDLRREHFKNQFTDYTHPVFKTTVENYDSATEKGLVHR